MISFSKYDIIVVKFPFASSLKYKARPAIVVSSDLYNENSRETLLILAVSSSIKNRLDFELEILHWKESGLLKPSIFKSALATIEKSFVISKLGSLKQSDVKRMEKLMEVIC